VIGPYVEGLSSYVAKSFDDVSTWITIGNQRRATAATGINDNSSRSHSVFTLLLTQTRVSECDGQTVPAELKHKNARFLKFSLESKYIYSHSAIMLLCFHFLCNHFLLNYFLCDRNLFIFRALSGTHFIWHLYSTACTDSNPFPLCAALLLGVTPTYLKSVCTLVSSLPARASLRSSTYGLLFFPLMRSATTQSKELCIYVGPSAWKPSTVPVPGVPASQLD